MTKKLKLYRQGDVLIRERAEPVAVATEVPRDKGAVVLAYGEVTGHSHAIHNPKVKLFRDSGNGGATYLSIADPAGAALQHEEHATIQLPAGHYDVTIQREYSPQAIRNVAD
ncbi:MAG TPA: hypothetical protein VM639_24450 [Dongiaceae bacterium]|nr:hypothetical protein [Dongiaceae bacterium]